MIDERCTDRYFPNGNLEQRRQACRNGSICRKPHDVPLCDCPEGRCNSEWSPNCYNCGRKTHGSFFGGACGIDCATEWAESKRGDKQWAAELKQLKRSVLG